MGLLPEQSSMIGDIHGVTVGIYKCRFLVGKMIPMKYDIYIYMRCFSLNSAEYTTYYCNFKERT